MEQPDAWIDALKVAGAALAALGVGIGGVLAGRKKREPEGEARVIAGSFLDKQAVVDVGVAVRNLDGTMRQILEEVRAIRADHEVEERVRIALRRRGIPDA